MARREALVVGVDIGTSSTKAVVFDGEGKVRGHHAVGYPLHTPIPGVAEQDPEEIYAACIVAISPAKLGEEYARLAAFQQGAWQIRVS